MLSLGRIFQKDKEDIPRLNQRDRFKTGVSARAGAEDRTPRD